MDSNSHKSSPWRKKGNWLGVLGGVAIILGLLAGPQAVADLTNQQARASQQATTQMAQVDPRALRPRPTEAVATPIDPRRIQEIVAAEAQAQATDPAGSNLKISGNATCFCESTCRDSSGKSITKNFSVGNFSWPLTEAKKQNCNTLCAQQVAIQANNWAAEGGLCGSGSCTGTSKLSTSETRGLPTEPWTRTCPPRPDGTAAACCAPFTGGNVAELFDFVKPSTGSNVTTNYQIRYMANTAFDAKLNAFATLAGLSKPGCNPSVVKYEIRRKSDNALMFSMTATYSGTGAPVLAPTPSTSSIPSGILPSATLPPNNATYVLLASGGCQGYTSSACTPKGFEFDIGVNIIGKVAAGGTDGTARRIID